MDNSTHRRVIDVNSVFSGGFLDSKGLYLYEFNKLPSLNFIAQMNGEKACAAFKQKFQHLIASEYQYRWYNKARKKYSFDETLFILSNRCIVAIDNYCEILHDGSANDFVEECTALMKMFQEKTKTVRQEVNLIVRAGRGFDLKAMEIKKTKLDLNLFYEDNFMAVDDIIRKRLAKQNDKGIVLLHGLPGTAKTTYLRHLIGRVKKRVLFLSPNIAADLMDPVFIELLIDNPNTVLIIEDAENILMDRRYNSRSGVSNLLNVSDGLLADFLNVQLICTFNSPVTAIDQALLRKGRLIAKYEFGKLSVQKSQALSDHLGFSAVVKEPMTVAEIANQNEPKTEIRESPVVGFRRNMELMN